MTLCDIVFPQNLPPLTYSVPDDLTGEIRTGQLVSALLRGKEKKGILLKIYTDDPERGTRYKLNPVTAILKPVPVLSPQLLSLLEWAAEYYLTNHGTMLKSMLFKEILSPSKRPVARRASKGSLRSTRYPDERDHDIVDKILSAVKKAEYGTFLFHLLSGKYALSILSGLLDKAGSTILLLPEVREAEELFSQLREKIGERICMYHSEMKKSERSDAVEGICSGRYEIVIGTRSAVFAPIHSLSLIVVLNEHNSAYKQEEAPRYHGRDVAVMRGYIENVPVLLASATPSIESAYNALKGRYTLMESSVHSGTAGKGPGVSLIDIKKDRPTIPFLSSRLLRRLRSTVQKGTQDSAYSKAGPGVMVIMQRRGFSMLKCEECDEIERCPQCITPLVLHRDKELLCHSCGYSTTPPESCSRCGSYRVTPFGAGTERIEDELRKETGMRVLRLDSDICEEQKEPLTVNDTEEALHGRTIIVSTLMPKRIPGDSLSLIAFLNPDIILNLPDVKATEKMAQEIFPLREVISDEGQFILQTEIPWHPLYKELKRWDYMGFLRSELKVRREISMPPCSRLIIMDIYIKEDKGANTADRISELLESSASDPQLDIHGPSGIEPRLKGFSLCYRATFKGSDRRRLRNAARHVRSKLEASGMTVRIDVDPVDF